MSALMHTATHGRLQSFCIEALSCKVKARTVRAYFRLGRNPAMKECCASNKITFNSLVYPQNELTFFMRNGVYFSSWQK